jgi:hypothetical protein
MLSLSKPLGAPPIVGHLEARPLRQHVLVGDCICVLRVVKYIVIRRCNLTISNRCRRCYITLAKGTRIGIPMCPECIAGEVDGKYYVESATLQNLPQRTAQEEQPKLSGVKHDQGKLRWDLLMWKAAQAQVAVSTNGLEKYAENGWKTVPNAKARYTAALLRHLYALSTGEEVDTESGKPHLWHVHWNSGALIELEGKDD